jgi:hypothetical protein
MIGLSNMRLTRTQLKRLIQESVDELRGDYNYHAFAEFWAEHYNIPYEVTHQAIEKNDYEDIAKVIARKNYTQVLSKFIDYFTHPGVKIALAGLEALEEYYPILEKLNDLVDSGNLAEETSHSSIPRPFSANGKTS